MFLGIVLSSYDVFSPLVLSRFPSQVASYSKVPRGCGSQRAVQTTSSMANGVLHAGSLRALVRSCRPLLCPLGIPKCGPSAMSGLQDTYSSNIPCWTLAGVHSTHDTFLGPPTLFFSLFFAVLGMETRALCIVGKICSIRPGLQPFAGVF